MSRGLLHLRIAWSRRLLPSTQLCHLAYTSPRAFSSTASTYGPRWINPKGTPQALNDVLASKDGKDKAPEKEQEHDEDTPAEQEPDEPSSSSSSSSSSASGSSASSSTPPSSAPPASSPSSPPSPPSSSSSSAPSPTPSSLSRHIVPSSYPTLLALPIARRPLFPGFYKAVVIRHPGVVAALKDSLAKGQPYVGAFLLKDEDKDTDVIQSLDEVHEVGVFAQITSVFAAAGGEEEGLTAVLYPHRRIKITDLVQPGKEKGDSAALPTPPASPAPTPVLDVEDTSTPAHLLTHPTIAIVATENCPAIPIAPGEDQHVRALSAEIVSVFKDIAQLNPLFRDQITNFSVNQVASAGVAQQQTGAGAPGDKGKDAAPVPATASGNVFDDPARLADFAAAVSTSSAPSLSATSSSGSTISPPSASVASISTALQTILATLHIPTRLTLALSLLKSELINAQLQAKLSRDVDSKIAKRQREYYLTEQLRALKKELGMDAGGESAKERMLEVFRERVEGKPIIDSVTGQPVMEDYEYTNEKGEKVTGVREKREGGLVMPVAVRKVWEDEMRRLGMLDAAGSEAGVVRGYLEWLTQIPWGRHTPENFSLPHAQRVLDEDHYGLDDVKKRIMEFLAVGKLRGTVQGKIICLVGPPGVGKTSIGKSIARALGRKFFRFSVGGLTDVAEIKGHRRTYVGALPGKIIQALKRVNTENPLVLIDEVDKIGRGHNGDPASALLEMLDPEQNSSFLDHYMDVPVDLSRVLFVCTANNLDTIPAPLLDRMEVLTVSGYVAAEKMAIALRYLAPQALADCGLNTPNVDVQLKEEAVDALIKWYCRESGVRNLKKHIEKIYRKAALKLVEQLGEEKLSEEAVQGSAASEVKKHQNEETSASPVTATSTPPATEANSSTSPASNAPPSDSAVAAEEATQAPTTTQRPPMHIPAPVHVEITPENLKEYVGPPVYQKDRLYPTAPPAGVSTGLGYTGNGSGAVMPIEAMSMPGKGALQLTGKLGEVIRESAQIGLSWVRAHAFDLGITKRSGDQFLTDRDVHVHMPEGSIGKEGPSAGTAILTAFVSLFTGTRVNPDIAMTGEISLVGQVLPVGGLKEKILAAHRAGIKTILAPAANRADIEENVPESVKEGIRLVYVDNVSEVLEEVFAGTPLLSRFFQRASRFLQIQRTGAGYAI
jgi:Lon-like ATP-dependent protease